MRQLSKIETALFLLGGLLMVVGSGLYVFLLWQPVAAGLFLLGAVCFASMQIRQRYEGGDTTIKRLRQIQLIADVLFVVSGILMLDSCYHFFAPFFSSRYDYLQLVYNKWIITLLMAAVFEIYTVHRLSAELKK